MITSFFLSLLLVGWAPRLGGHPEEDPRGTTAVAEACVSVRFNLRIKIITSALLCFMDRKVDS